MLTITIPACEDKELYDESTNEFIVIKGLKKEQTLRLEHSLLSLSKWESKWHKPFLSKDEKTFDEIIDYIKCMTLTSGVDPHVYECLTPDNVKEINDYIDDPMTATIFNDQHTGKNSRKIVTNEEIYYWMVTLNIPFECEKWHINRLLTLVKVCNIKNQPPQKRSQRETISHYAELNAARRKKLNSKG